MIGAEVARGFYFFIGVEQRSVLAEWDIYRPDGAAGQQCQDIDNAEKEKNMLAQCGKDNKINSANDRFSYFCIVRYKNKFEIKYCRLCALLCLHVYFLVGDIVADELRDNVFHVYGFECVVLPGAFDELVYFLFHYLEIVLRYVGYEYLFVVGR